MRVALNIVVSIELDGKERYTGGKRRSGGHYWIDIVDDILPMVCND